MCGFVGIWDLKKKLRSNELVPIVKKMRDSLISRGPDDKNIWLDKKNNFCVGHRRLSIIEISKLGLQPMISRNQRYVIAYNGEIYNYLDIKKELSNLGVIFNSNCDTEILLEAISFWGLEKALTKIAGMFSFSVWDNKVKKLFLVRDRLGIKPLYWSIQKDIMYFGSQPKSFLKCKYWEKELNIDTLLNYFQFGYIPSPSSIYESTNQLNPGCYLEINFNGKYKIKRYWDLKNKFDSKDTSSVAPNILKEEFNNLLEKVVSEHLISDVPIGCFLSGGIDSSVITLFMQKIIKDRNIKTYSVGFTDKTFFDETEYSNSIAKILKTNHVNLFLNSKEILDNIPTILNEYDEPFADSSQLPTYLLSKLMKEKVTVCLSGDGGDELFAGYNRYLFAKKIKKIFYFLPLQLRKSISNLILKLPPTGLDAFLSIFGDKFNKKINSDKLQKFAEILKIRDFNSVYNHLLSFYPKNEIPFNKDILINRKGTIEFDVDAKNYIEKMQFFDTKFYLPNDILTKVDRASMAHGLEVRVPFLDHRIVEFAFNLPQEMKIYNNQTKVILREILSKKIPKGLLNRPKMGFSVPLMDWLRGPLKEWAYDLIYNTDYDDGVIDKKSIKKTFNEHIENKRNWQNKIWTVLVYINWRKNNFN